LALLAYNGLLYLSLRDSPYLWYLLFVISMALGQGAWTGLFFAQLWPQWPARGNLATVMGCNLTGLFGANLGAEPIRHLGAVFANCR